MSETNLTPKELKEALVNQQIKINKATNEENRNLSALVLKHLNALLEFCPDHTGPCSDEYPDDWQTKAGEVDCPRCQLLRTQQIGTSVMIVRIDFLVPTSLPENPENIHVRIRIEQDEMC